MGVWTSYENRVNINGATVRDEMLNREQSMLLKKMKDSLSYHSILINGVKREASIVNSDNLNEKTMFSLPGEDFICGDVVDWANNHWLITEKDANNEMCTKVKLLQCNHLLKWVDNKHQIHEQWCVIEDGTKYLTGEYEDRKFIVTRGDSRIAMTIGINEFTKEFGREHRFLIDEPDSPEKLAYLLTKPLKVGWNYNGHGVYKFVLQESVSTDNDNMELGIADYYKHFKRPDSNNGSAGTKPENGKETWI